MTARAFLGIGSSLDPEANVPGALGLLRKTPGVEMVGLSTFYRTPPLPAPGAPPESVAGDPDFLNGVAEIRTTLSPEELREALDGIEKALGRVRTENKYAPRTLDLDLLLYLEPSGQAFRDQDSWTVAHPVHPDVSRRPWVAIPLLELAPKLVLPPDGTPLQDLAAAFPDAGGRADVPLTRALTRRFL